LGPALCERLGKLPVECYPLGLLLLGSLGVMLFSRGRRQAVAGHSIAAEHLHGAGPGVVGWMMPMTGRLQVPGASAAAGHHAGSSLFGALMATVGLAITAVGASAVLRAYVVQQPEMLRPGVTIAAAGQFVLLLGIVALAVRSAQNGRSRQGGEIEQLQSEVSRMSHALAAAAPWQPFGSAFPVPVFVPATTSGGGNAGQIAQLKAQLACLSQQLDHLGMANGGGHAKAA